MVTNVNEELRERRFASIVLRIIVGIAVPLFSTIIIFIVGIVNDGSSVIMIPMVLGAVASIASWNGVSSALDDIRKYMT